MFYLLCRVGQRLAFALGPIIIGIGAFIHRVLGIGISQGAFDSPVRLAFPKLPSTRLSADGVFDFVR